MLIRSGIWPRQSTPFEGVTIRIGDGRGFATTITNASKRETAVYPKWGVSRFEAKIKVPEGVKINVGKIAEQPVVITSPKYRGVQIKYFFQWTIQKNGSKA